MSDDTPRIIVDDDWKEQARRDKEREAAEAQAKAEAEGGPEGEPQFMDILNLLVTQSMVGLGLVQVPGQPPMPPNPPMAKFYIDLLGVLETKTAGNLTEEEAKHLTDVGQELRMTFVQLMNAAASAGAPHAPTTPPLNE